MPEKPDPAPPWRRFAAALYDVFPLIALWMLVAALVLLAFGGRVDVAHPTVAYRRTLQLALLAVTAAYFVVSWTRGGQTIGMRAWRLRVVASDGMPLPWPRALLRFAVAVPAFAACAIGVLWCFVDRDRRGWHDLAARSLVVPAPPRVGGGAARKAKA
jgi:uncharacterized RDD family membrane protein YckC